MKLLTYTAPGPHMIFQLLPDEGPAVKFYTEKLLLPEPWTYEVLPGPVIAIYFPPHDYCRRPTHDGRELKISLLDFWQESVEKTDKKKLGRWLKQFNPTERRVAGKWFSEAQHEPVVEIPTWTRTTAFGVKIDGFDGKVLISWQRYWKCIVDGIHLKAA